MNEPKKCQLWMSNALWWQKNHFPSSISDPQVGHFAWPGTFKVKVRQLQIFFYFFHWETNGQNVQGNEKLLNIWHMNKTWKSPKEVPGPAVRVIQHKRTFDIDTYLCFEISFLCIFVQKNILTVLLFFATAARGLKTKLFTEYWTVLNSREGGTDEIFKKISKFFF